MRPAAPYASSSPPPSAAIVFLFTLGVGPLDPPTDVSDTMIEQAVPEGDGRNVVNVILVDIRGMDTSAS